jgi:hypothetical protein
LKNRYTYFKGLQGNSPQWSSEEKDSFKNGAKMKIKHLTIPLSTVSTSL